MLYTLALCFALIGLVLYCVLGGADFGAGFWQLTAGTGPAAERIRERAHESMGPVWEANHVWLIFVLTVIWTAYPRMFGSLASSLAVALILALIGIVIRGGAYALRTATESSREQRAIDTALGVSSLLAPFALGAAAGGIASGRVPVGNAAGHQITSWVNPTSILIGVLAVLTGAYLSAVFLSGDAQRAGDEELAERFRTRTLGAAVLSGAVALGGFVVLHNDAHHLYHGLLDGAGLPALIVSVLAGGGTFVLVFVRRYEPARLTAAVAVAAIVAGWALAQSPHLLPGLTVRQAAAPHDTQVAVIVAIVAGGALLAPSLATLFRLALRGTLGHEEDEEDEEDEDPDAETATDARSLTRSTPRRPELLVRIAGALLVAGVGLVNVADAEWAHLLGATCYLTFLATAFRVALPSPD